MSNPEFIQRFDAEPQFWQFLRGLRSDDLLVELIQNDLDANATRTSITFTDDRLICQGDGEPVSADGWRRLSFVTGAGVEVESKRFRIGVKNHGLKACFWLGDEITVRSDGLRTVQTLYKDGHESEPSPGTFQSPVPDVDAPSTGCLIEVPYRRQELSVAKGENLTIGIPDERSLEGLFRNACELLPSRLLGVVRPGIRDQYTLALSHHSLGSVEIRWRAKRGRTVNRRGGKQSTVFARECEISSKVPSIGSSTIHERASAFRLPFPSRKRLEIPDFFFSDRRSFWAEVAWLTDKRGTPKPTNGVRRYPIGYDTTSESSLTGVGVHFSAPFVSGAERHGVSEMDPLNDYIDNACKDALVDIMSSQLLHRYGGKAMELFMPSKSSPDNESLSDLVRRTLDRRALPLADRKLRSAKRSNRLVLGPRRISSGGSRRVVLPMFTWDHERISPLLSAICPSDEDQIDRTVPGPILRYLNEQCYLPSNGFDGRVTNFDESDAIQRLQPQLEAEHFQWKDESEWQATLGNPTVAKTYLDVAFEAIQRGRLDFEAEVIGNTYLPDHSSAAQPLVAMFNAASLPPHLGQREYALILHPELQHHRLLRRRAWKPRPFTFDDYLDHARLENASVAERKSFWTWLRQNWRTVKRRQTLTRTADFPVWPSASGGFLPLDRLCEPRSPRIASAVGDSIVRPSRELLEAGLVSRTGRGRLTFRNTPSFQELERFLAEQIGRFPRDRTLTASERREFHKFETVIADLASSSALLKQYLGELDERFRCALDKDGNLRDPGELVRDTRELQRLHLLDKHIIDRRNSILDRTSGWKPRTAPSSDQIVDTVREDGFRFGAHVPRLQEYGRQSKAEGIEPIGLLDVPCIPVEGELCSPNEIALRGSRDFWGDWKLRVPVTDINAETQRHYRLVGVVGGTPDSSTSRRFFQWLASQDTDVVANHADQILRHINHPSGPRSWSGEFAHVPFILIESEGGGVRLVTRAETTKRRSKVVIPDFAALEEAIRQHPVRHPVDMAIIESRRVREPVTARLREFGLRTLSDYAGDPVEARGMGNISIPPSHFDFREVLDSLQSGLKGRELQKRLARLDLVAPESALRSNWRERLADVQEIRTADSVTAIYKLGRDMFPVPVDGKLDKGSGTLWIKADTDLREVFFIVIAEHIFELPKKYHGLVLDQAYKMEMRERYPLEHLDGVQVQEDAAEDTNNQRSEDSNLSATSAVHSTPEPDPSKNIPNPGPIPQGDGAVRRVSKPSRGSSRPQSVDENAQIADLKAKQYAWHCQSCLAGAEPETLAPISSYVEDSENRRRIIEAQHCDHVNAGGARHAGNIILLCHNHHGALGDAVTRTEITRALGQASNRKLTFNSDNGVSNSIQGKVVNTHPPQRETPVSLFFTNEHADYWLTKATEEGLL